MTVTAPTPDPAARFLALIDIMRTLRTPGTGCAWDCAQTFATIAPYTVEEAYEVADAIARHDMADLRDELGDVLFQVVFHAQMASEAGAFGIGDVVEAISTKMIARHPHVFGNAGPRTADAQLDAWEAQKAQERAARAPGASALDGVAIALPALKRAQKLQARAARVGFDWPDATGAFAKIDEETAEIKAALAQAANVEIVAGEVGDLLFSVVNLARHLGVDAEAALAGASAKFERRFKRVEALAVIPLEAHTAEALDALWTQAKQDLAS